MRPISRAASAGPGERQTRQGSVAHVVGGIPHGPLERRRDRAGSRAASGPAPAPPPRAATRCARRAPRPADARRLARVEQLAEPGRRRLTGRAVGAVEHRLEGGQHVAPAPARRAPPEGASPRRARSGNDRRRRRARSRGRYLAAPAARTASSRTPSSPSRAACRSRPQRPAFAAARTISLRSPRRPGRSAPPARARCRRGACPGCEARPRRPQSPRPARPPPARPDRGSPSSLSSVGSASVARLGADPAQRLGGGDAHRRLRRTRRARPPCAPRPSDRRPPLVEASGRGGANLVVIVARGDAQVGGRSRPRSFSPARRSRWRRRRASRRRCP